MKRRKRARRYHVSVTRATYERLQALAKGHAVSMSTLIANALTDAELSAEEQRHKRLLHHELRAAFHLPRCPLCGEATRTDIRHVCKQEREQLQLPAVG